MPVQSVSDSEFETTEATERRQREPGRDDVRRTSTTLAEFLSRGDEQVEPSSDRTKAKTRCSWLVKS